MTKEQVLIFNEKYMDGFKDLPGISIDKRDMLHLKHKVLDYAYYMDRDFVEKYSEYKQVIPYVVMKFNNRYLVYKRTKKGGEGRLHDKHSIGIGGHINPIDGTDNPVANAISREITEEVKFPSDTKYTIEPLALIYDDSNDVGKVHFGFVWLVEFDKETKELPTPAEDAVTEFQWLHKSKIKYVSNLENWSKLVLEVL